MTDADLTLRDEVARILHDVWQNAEGPTHFDQAGADALMPLLARVCAEADNEARLSEMQGTADSLTGQLIAADAYATGLAAGEARVRGRVEAVDFTSRRLGTATADPWCEGWNRALEVCRDDLRAALAEPNEGDA